MIDLSIENAVAGATLIALGVAAVALFFLLVWRTLQRRPNPSSPARSFFDVIGR